jgi:WD40 repeat protein
VILWDAATGAQAAVLDTFDKQAGSGVAFSPDSRLVAAAGTAGTVRIWSVPDGALRQTVSDGTRSAEHLAWSPDGHALAVSSADGTVKAWDVTTGREIARFAHGRGTVSAAFTADGSRIAVASSDRTISIWDVRSASLLRRLEGHGEAVHAVAFSPDGSRLSSASSDGTLRVWDTAGGDCLLTIPSDNTVYATAWSPDGRRVAMIVLDKTLRMLDAGPGVSHSSPFGAQPSPNRDQRPVARHPEDDRPGRSAGRGADEPLARRRPVDRAVRLPVIVVVGRDGQVAGRSPTKPGHLAVVRVGDERRHPGSRRLRWRCCPG